MGTAASKIKLLICCVLVSLVVVLVYYIFETSIHSSITYIWDTLFKSGSNRILVIPLAIVGALVFFGVQHLIDPNSEKMPYEGLKGEQPSPTIRNFVVVLAVGYFSLVGGASLGPEAILVPACTIIGAYAGIKLFKKNPLAVKAMSAAAIMALMTAFFHSYIIGILSVFLVAQLAKTKVNIELFVIAIISSISAYLLLNFIDPSNRYFNFPHFTWKLALVDILVGIVLIIVGFISTFALKYSHMAFARVKAMSKIKIWWKIALFAAIGLCILYLIGGPFVEFTGNESINPMLQQASGLGVASLIGIVIIKIMAIGWSKALGYRGGLIFPMIFVASTLVAISQLIVSNVNFGIGIVAAMIGILAAERKAHILL